MQQGFRPCDALVLLDQIPLQVRPVGSCLLKTLLKDLPSRDVRLGRFLAEILEEISKGCEGSLILILILKEVSAGFISLFVREKNKYVPVLASCVYSSSL